MEPSQTSRKLQTLNCTLLCTLPSFFSHFSSCTLWLADIHTHTRTQRVRYKGTNTRLHIGDGHMMEYTRGTHHFAQCHACAQLQRRIKRSSVAKVVTGGYLKARVTAPLIAKVEPSSTCTTLHRATWPLTLWVVSVTRIVEFIERDYLSGALAIFTMRLITCFTYTGPFQFTLLRSFN